MSIRVLFFASLADATGVREVELDAAAFDTVGAILAKCSSDYPRLRERRGSVLCAVNSNLARLEFPVHDGDEVAFFPPVSGG